MSKAAKYVVHMADYLDTYSGRDKLLKMLSYLTKLLTVSTPSKSAQKKFKDIGNEMSECRMLLRLLDDFSTLRSVIKYGWGKEEPDSLIRWIQVLQNTTDVVYCALEHIYWAGVRDIVLINVDKWNLATTLLWIFSIHLSFLKSIRKIKHLQIRKTNLERIHQPDVLKLKEINKERTSQVLICTCLLLDLGYAINYLPAGVLWGERLQTWQVGALGTMSALIAIYKALKSHIETKKLS
ncbi:PREDICTED: peroxisomal membrane protein 11C [Dinoponera quadriceps]|uniref:Peroxisomal membrane protein 11C n=1 Tax=Dinoponera quadriceps TaxID=609295 RepID=A0A6P3YGB8_DINQU|nr:PREDICTED: peroxisomal membrane protein 11C [Dinoponera quadriceps]XP_014488834.1 PREDICTED: peroxisomal membrane protein 11C [Dinoponera quadriceps]XP_014488835.1 PREDICTED: peroxisomal membrane protein 11C [Dinoponera quadriceps]